MKIVITENDVSGASLEPFLAKSHVRRNNDFRNFKNSIEDITAFALQAKAMFKERCTHSLCTPVLRVDIFETETFNLIVNELENLDALIEAMGRQRDTIDSSMVDFKSNFFFDKLLCLVNKISSLL